MKKLFCYILSVGVLFSMTANMACGKTEESGQSLESSSLRESSVSSQENSSLEEEDASSETSSLETPSVIVEKVAVKDVVLNKIGSTNYLTQFNRALTNLILKKFLPSQVKAISITDVVFAEDGKIDIQIESWQAGNVKNVTYVGDTRPYEAGYRLAYDKDDYIAEILQSLDLTINDEIEKDSEKHKALVSTFTALVDSFQPSIEALESISAEQLKEPKPVEKITVQSIVDEVFADIDFDADLKESVQKILSEVNKNVQLIKLYSVDYDVAQPGELKFYIEYNMLGLSKVAETKVSIDTTSISNYLGMVREINAFIEDAIAIKNYTLNSEIEKNSNDHVSLIEYLTDYKSKYFTEKAILDGVSKSNNSIKVETLITPIEFDSTKMEELGITSMNAFAEALLTNKRGEGFDKVTGWTMDDVVATYVTDFGAEMIDYSSRMNMLVVTSQGIFSYELWTIRSIGNTTDRYSMLLNGDPNTKLKYATNNINYSDNAIVYDDNGERKTKTNNVEVVFYTDEKYTTLGAKKTKKNQA